MNLFLIHEITITVGRCSAFLFCIMDYSRVRIRRFAVVRVWSIFQSIDQNLTFTPASIRFQVRYQQLTAKKLDVEGEIWGNYLVCNFSPCKRNRESTCNKNRNKCESSTEIVKILQKDTLKKFSTSSMNTNRNKSNDLYFSANL